MKSRLAAAILAGGEAERFGRIPKGTIELPDSRTIIETLIREIVSAGIDEIIISANDPEPYTPYAREIVPDIRPGQGPLGGIEAALSHYADRWRGVLFLPCDLPGMTAREITALQAAFHQAGDRIVVAETGLSFWQPLCVIVHNAALKAVSQAINEGKRRALELWQVLGAVPVHFDDPTPFFNVNTPEDLERWTTLKKENVPKPGQGGKK